MTVPNLLRKMADNGFEYASRHNLLRTSQIHGEQEAKLLLDEAFSFDETHEQSTEQSQRMEVEESWQMIQGAMSFCFLIDINLDLPIISVWFHVTLYTSSLWLSNWSRMPMVASWLTSCPRVQASRCLGILMKMLKATRLAIRLLPTQALSSSLAQFLAMFCSTKSWNAARWYVSKNTIQSFWVLTAKAVLP